MVVYSCTASYWGSISLFLLKNMESVTKRQKIPLLSHLGLNHARALGPDQMDGLVNINLLVPACREGRWEAEKPNSSQDTLHKEQGTDHTFVSHGPRSYVDHMIREEHCY